jgi:hypothetical protein
MQRLCEVAVLASLQNDGQKYVRLIITRPLSLRRKNPNPERRAVTFPRAAYALAACYHTHSLAYHHEYWNRCKLQEDAKDDHNRYRSVVQNSDDRASEKPCDAITGYKEAVCRRAPLRRHHGRHGGRYDRFVNAHSKTPQRRTNLT